MRTGSPCKAISRVEKEEMPRPLLVILKGTIRIELRNGMTKDFSAGELFIAEDYLLPDIVFDNTIHGHRAEVVGKEDLAVLHLKLEKRNN